MDKITNSLQNYLKKRRIKSKSMFNADVEFRLEEQTSTVFHVTRKFDKLKMSVVIDIYPKDKTVYLSAHPWDLFDNSRMDELKSLESKWNGIGMFTTLSIEEEKGVIEPDRYCFQLTAKFLADKEGLSFTLWDKYIKLLIKESLDAWEMFYKIINPEFCEFLQYIVLEDGSDATFQAYSFN